MAEQLKETVKKEEKKDLDNLAMENIMKSSYVVLIGLLALCSFIITFVNLFRTINGALFLALEVMTIFFIIVLFSEWREYKEYLNQNRK